MEKISLNTPISELGLSVRASNGLTRGGLRTLGDILKAGYEGVRDCRCIGEKVAKEISDKLNQYGYPLDGFAEHESERQRKMEEVFKVYAYDKDADTEVLLEQFPLYRDAAMFAKGIMKLMHKDMLRNTNGEPFDWAIIEKPDGIVETVAD